MRYSELVSYHERFKITERDNQSSEIKSFAQMSLPYTPVQVNEGEKEKIYLSIYYIKGTTWKDKRQWQVISNSDEGWGTEKMG